MTEIRQSPRSHSVPELMQAMRLHDSGAINSEYCGLVAEQVPVPHPAAGEVLIKVQYCGVCHTELDEIEGRAAPSHLPRIPGHQMVGLVVADGPGCELDLAGKVVGLVWIHSSCGECNYCRNDRENLCAKFKACGKDHDGGYAEYVAAPEAFVYPIPATVQALQAAPPCSVMARWDTAVYR